MADNGNNSDEENNGGLAKVLGDDYEKFEKVLDLLCNESALGSVIVGAAWLDDKLKALIELALHDDEQVRKVFTDRFTYFGHRIQCASDLDLICKREKEILDIITQIRTPFAHNILASFDDDTPKKLILRLEPFLSLKIDPKVHPRDYYVYAVALLHAYLSVRVSSAQEITDMTKRLHKMRWLAKKHGEELEGKDKS